MDKTLDSGQTNAVSYDDFLTLTNDFIDSHDDIHTVFVASDESRVKELIRRNYPGKRVIDTGQVTFWKSPEGTRTKADHAVLDSLLLSRCKYLIKNQSALSGFAKVLNPRLEAYRVAACKLFYPYIPHFPQAWLPYIPYFPYVPYFPDAYIPPLTSEDPTCQTILKRLLRKDWTQNGMVLRKFGKPFIAMEHSRTGTVLRVIFGLPV